MNDFPVYTDCNPEIIVFLPLKNPPYWNKWFWTPTSCSEEDSFCHQIPWLCFQQDDWCCEVGGWQHSKMRHILLFPFSVWWKLWILQLQFQTLWEAKGGHSTIRALSGYPEQDTEPPNAHTGPCDVATHPSPICSWFQHPMSPEGIKWSRSKKRWHLAILKGKIAFGNSPWKKKKKSNQMQLSYVQKFSLFRFQTHLSLMEVPNIHNGIIHLCSEVRGCIRLWGVEYSLRTLLKF